MANRVSASIEIGGFVSHDDFAALAAIIADESLSTDWEGEPFEPGQLVEGQSLRLFAHEVAWGRFSVLEARCQALGLAYVRWHGGYGSDWGPGRVVFSGTGVPGGYPADEDDTVVMGRALLQKLGSLEAAMAWFDAADFTVPPLVVAVAGAAAANGPRRNDPRACGLIA